MQFHLADLPFYRIFVSVSAKGMFICPYQINNAIMKLKSFLLSAMILLLGCFTVRAGDNDTIWTRYHWDGYEVSILGGDLYYYCTSYVKVIPDQQGRAINISAPDANLKRISENSFYITPLRSGNLQLKINNEASYKIQVFPMPVPSFYLNGDHQKWYSIISKEAVRNSSGIVVSDKFQSYPVIEYQVTVNKMGDLITKTIRGSGMNKEIRDLLLDEDIGPKIYFENISIANPDGTSRMIPDQVFTLVDSYENEFIRRVVHYKPYTADPNILHSGLRVKITGSPSEKDRQTVKAFIDTLSSLIQSIDVCITDRQPSLTICFDSINDSQAIREGYVRIPLGYLRYQGNMIFPTLVSYKMIIYPSSGISDREREICIQKNIFHLLGIFSENAPDSSILNYKALSEYDKNMIRTLYSADGEYMINKIVDKNFDEPGRTGLYVVLLLWTLCISLISVELYRYYALANILKKLRYSVLIRMLESLILSLIPAAGLLLVICIDGNFRELNLPFLYWKWLAPLYLLWGLAFLGIDSILKKIKHYAAKLILVFILSYLAVVLAYQVIYLILIPEIIPLKIMSWKYTIIPFIIALYRGFALFQKNKLSGVLQKKELEIAQQKELKFRSDLNALQARVNPHFLYNSLNSIAALSHIDADKTEQMALSLARLFRYNTNKENATMTTIREEAEMLRIYLDVEQHRFGENLEYHIDLDETLLNFAIPRALLQPLVENAVKHGVSKLAEKGVIKISAKALAGKVVLEVADNGPGFPEELLHGYGLQHTYEKLKLLYNKPFEIEFENTPEKKIRLILSM
jgi:signal transduction histidine kinase